MVSIRLPLASKRVRYGAVVILAALILLVSVRETGTAIHPYYGPFGIIRRDKWSHAIGYAMLTATLAYALVAPVSSTPTDRRYRLALSVCLAVAFGVCVELIQWQIPYRTASEIDALANTIGSCVMAILWWAMTRTRNIRFGQSDSISG